MPKEDNPAKEKELGFLYFSFFDQNKKQNTKF